MQKLQYKSPIQIRHIKFQHKLPTHAPKMHAPIMTNFGG